jgi:putative ABC transport system ATP-binding protein
MTELASKNMISVAGLGKTVAAGREPLTILHDIAFNVPAGASLAIVGASGSGKSTLLALLAGLDRPSAGSVSLAGRDLAALNEDQCAGLRAELAGFVFQSFQLLPEFTALENVMLPLEITGRYPRRVAEQLAREWLGKVGLADRLTHRPRELSGGEQQRVALARAFAPGPRILFADEPTGSLDAATGERVADLLFDLNREAGTTLVLVTHEARLAERCDSLLKLEAGRVTEFRSRA